MNYLGTDHCKEHNIVCELDDWKKLIDSKILTEITKMD
jgi:hypothetical protein